MCWLNRWLIQTWWFTWSSSMKFCRFNWKMICDMMSNPKRMKLMKVSMLFMTKVNFALLALNDLLPVEGQCPVQFEAQLIISSLIFFLLFLPACLITEIFCLEETVSWQDDLWFCNSCMDPPNGQNFYTAKARNLLISMKSEKRSKMKPTVSLEVTKEFPTSPLICEFIRLTVSDRLQLAFWKST